MLKLRPKFLFGWLLSVTGAAGIHATDTPAVVVAVQVRGTVEVQHGAEAGYTAVTEGRQLVVNDIVTTAKGSSVVLVLENNTFVSLRENSRLKITTALQSPQTGEAVAAKGAESPEPGASNTHFELAFGEMLARVRKLNPSSTFEVQTPVSVAAVRGTVFEVSYRADRSGPAQYRLSTASGLVHVTPQGGELASVAAGEEVNFSARISGQRIKIQPVKLTKLSPQKYAQLDKEALDTARIAGDLAKRAQATAAASSANTTARGDEKAKEMVPDKPEEMPSRENGKAGASDSSKTVTPTPAKKIKVPDRTPKK